MRLFLYILGSFYFCFLGSANAETYSVGFYNYPPMMIQSGNTGIYKDIFDEISKITGDKFKIEYYPYARLTVRFNRGLIDIEPGVFPAWVEKQKVPGEFSHSFGKIIDVLVFNPGKKFSVSKPTDLSGKTLGMVRGYAYPNLSELIEKGNLTRVEGLDENQLLNMLKLKRFDQILINKAVIQYNILKFEKFRDFEIGDELGNYDVTMRVHPDKKDLLPRLNEAIKKLITNRSISKIYAKYGVSL